MGIRGQIQISFGMIFSIIIIIATLSIAGYVIYYFVNLSNCTNTGLLYKSFDERIQEAWNSPITKAVFEGSVSGGATSVCFGNLSQSPNADSRTQFNQLVKYRSSGANVFLYPLSNACGTSNPYYKVEHMETGGFFCVPVISGKIKVTITKDSKDSYARVSK